MGMIASIKEARAKREAEKERRRLEEVALLKARAKRAKEEMEASKAELEARKQKREAKKAADEERSTQKRHKESEVKRAKGQAEKAEQEKRQARKELTSEKYRGVIKGGQTAVKITVKAAKSGAKVVKSVDQYLTGEEPKRPQRSRPSGGKAKSKKPKGRDIGMGVVRSKRRGKTKQHIKI